MLEWRIRELEVESSVVLTRRMQEIYCSKKVKIIHLRTTLSLDPH